MSFHTCTMFRRHHRWNTTFLCLQCFYSHFPHLVFYSFFIILPNYFLAFHLCLLICFFLLFSPDFPFAFPATIYTFSQYSWHHCQGSHDSNLRRCNFSTTLIFFCMDLRSVMALNTNPSALWSLDSFALLCTQLYVVSLMLYVRHFQSLGSRSDTRDITSRHFPKGYTFVRADCIVNSSAITVSRTSAT
jgi:hypothetical protein